VDLRQKGTDLHAATVVGDTVGDPFKDTSSVALNPVIKFTTLFGLLAVEIAVTIQSQSIKTLIGGFFFIIALIFVYRSFYSMRIPEEDLNADDAVAKAAPDEKKTIDRGVTKTGTSGVVGIPGIRADKSTR
jgi:K(+)-stimulated pyrophosphate-energized sodium pump